MIYHIVGHSGSGKSTLGLKLKKALKSKVVVLDTDDILDENALSLVRTFDFKKKNYAKFKKELIKLNKKKFDTFIKKNERKNIIIVGHMHQGMNIKADKTYFIKLDPEAIWRQYMLRTSESIRKHTNDIKRLLRGKVHPDKIRILFCHKFHIRMGFDCFAMHRVKKFGMRFRKENKIHMHADHKKIYSSIYKKLK